MNGNPFPALLFICAVIFATACHSTDSTQDSAGDLLRKPPFATVTDSIMRFPGDAALYAKRAELLTQNNLHELAAADYKKCWELKQDAPSAMRYASNLSIVGKAGQEIAFLQECIRHFPEEPGFKRLLGEAYVQAGQIQQAIGLYGSILQKDSLDFETWFEKGRLLSQAGDTAAAIAALQKAYSLQPVSTYALELAHLYAEQKNAIALKICDQVLKKDSTHELIDPFFIKGIYYSNTLQYPAAIVQYDSCISRDWKFTEAYIEKGIIFFKQKNYDGALNIFRMAATVSDTDPDAYYWIGRCLESVNKNQEAAQYYQRAIVLDKNFSEAKEALRRVENLKG